MPPEIPTIALHFGPFSLKKSLIQFTQLFLTSTGSKLIELIIIPPNIS
ncbi:MAG: hypothetical protein ACI4VE_02085 [Clostridia bacterium]